MIICPHCGFEQPQDIFCAKCGVNMETYISQNQSFFKKVVESTGFYIVLLCIVVSITTFFVYEKILIHLQDEDTDIFSSQLNDSIEDLPKSQGLLQKSDIVDEGFTQLSQNDAFLSQDILPSTSPSIEIQESTKEDDTFSSGQIRVYFVVLPTDSPLIQTAEPRGSQHAVIFDFAQALRAAENKTILTQRTWEVTKQPQGENQREVFALRGEENDSFGQIGIVIDLNVTELSETSVTLEPDINVFLVELEGRALQEALSFQITLNRSEAVFVFGLLPHRPPSSIEEQLLPPALQNLMKSEDFLGANPQLEFFAVMEYAP